jgi:anti-anti-sigma regulatory factor
MSDQQEQPRDKATGTPTEQPRDKVAFTRTDRSRDEVVLAAKGALTDEAADAFKLQLDGLIAGGWPIVTLDLSAVKGISSGPLGKIVFLMKKLQEKQRTFRIRGCDAGLYEQFKKISFDRIIDIQP